jgi:hypothetical protein
VLGHRPKIGLIKIEYPVSVVESAHNLWLHVPEIALLSGVADLANTRATRALLAVAAFQWRKLAERAVERQKPHWPFALEAIRPN